MKEPLVTALRHAHNTNIQADFKKHVNNMRTKVENQMMGRLLWTRNRIKAFKIIFRLYLELNDQKNFQNTTMEESQKDLQCRGDLQDTGTCVKNERARKICT